MASFMYILLARIEYISCDNPAFLYEATQPKYAQSKVQRSKSVSFLLLYFCTILVNRTDKGEKEVWLFRHMHSPYSYAMEATRFDSRPVVCLNMELRVALI